VYLASHEELRGIVRCWASGDGKRSRAGSSLPGAAGGLCGRQRCARLHPEGLRDGNDFKLSSLHGHCVLLFFYRGYWCPYCMTEMSDFADHSDELAKLGVRSIPISVDDQQHAHDVWEKAAGKNSRF
jgi:hypothetical protein